VQHVFICGVLLLNCGLTDGIDLFDICILHNNLLYEGIDLFFVSGACPANDIPVRYFLVDLRVNVRTSGKEYSSQLYSMSEFNVKLTVDVFDVFHRRAFPGHFDLPVLQLNT